MCNNIFIGVVMNKIGQPKAKTKSGRVGSFFLGIFIGLLLTILLIGGTGCFIYFKVSPSWINKHFKTNISLPYGLNDFTLQRLVSVAYGIGSNYETYTLNDLDKDFGIKIDDVLFGIDIKDLKSVGLGEIPSKVSSKIANISRRELSSINLPESMEKLFAIKQTFTVDGSTLKDDNGSVPFEYRVENGKVYIKSFDPFSVEDGNTVPIPLEALPLKDAFKYLNLSKDISLKKLKEYFSIDKLPDFLERLDPETTLNELETKIKSSPVADLLSYKIEGDKVYEGSISPEHEVKGIQAFIAKKTIGELSSGNLEIHLNNIFSEEDFSSGFLSLIDEQDRGCTLQEVASVLNKSVKNATLGQLVDADVISGEENRELAENIRTKKIKTTQNPGGVELSSLKLVDFLNLLFTDSAISSVIFVS